MLHGVNRWKICSIVQVSAKEIWHEKPLDVYDFQIKSSIHNSMGLDKRGLPLQFLLFIYWMAIIVLDTYGH